MDNKDSAKAKSTLIARFIIAYVINIDNSPWFEFKRTSGVSVQNDSAEAKSTRIKF